MNLVVHHPGPALGDCVAAMIHFSGFEPWWQREKLLPDGVVELVVDLTDRPKRLFRNETDAAGDDFRKAWISGVQHRPIVIEAQPQAAMLVIAFRPGGVLPFIGGASEALANAVVSLYDVVGDAASGLRDRVLPAATPAAMFAAAEAWLLERSGGPVRRPRLIRHLVAHLDAGTGPIRTLVADTGRSERQVQMLARRWLGTGLKRYARLRRFQRLLTDVSGQDDWAGLAAKHGYSDQSHLGHEFRAFAAMTPTAFAERFAGLTDFLPLAAPADCGFLQDGRPAAAP